jgi:hypothetical protein
MGMGGQWFCPSIEPREPIETSRSTLALQPTLRSVSVPVSVSVSVSVSTVSVRSCWGLPSDLTLGILKSDTSRLSLYRCVVCRVP